MYFDLSIPSQLAGALLPDLILVIGAMLLLLVSVWRKESLGHARLVGLLSIVVCLITFASVVWLWRAHASASAGIIAVDNFRWATDCIVLAATIIAATLMIDYSEREQLVSAESYVLLLLAASGMMLLAASRDLIVVFLGIELMSIASYVLCGLDRRSSRGAEAALKYFLLGAFSTGFLLYGIALVYGATGSTDIATIGTAVTGETFDNPLLLAGIGLLIVGFCFKVAAVPFHMWTPDVYEGAATPISAFMAAAVKAAAFAAFLRVWIEAFPGATSAWIHPLQWLAVITMIGGNVVALQQKNMKRMLAYSSIAHAGYLLVTVVVANSLGASAFLFYLVAYTLATMGAFAVVIALGEPGERNQEIADYAGLWHVSPWLASAMAVFMLALLGFPIAGGMGFFAKWYVIDAALHAPHPQTVLAVILVIASVISAGYYLGVVLVMFMKPRASDAVVVRPVQTGTFLVIYLSAFILLLFGVLPNGFVVLARDSVPISMVNAPAGPPVTAAATQ
ncbi:MAG TPA: NADH-quinone oxidoreductase subunit N [Gemmatimonadaceae bacterium]|nr:NADH-quinone oxidoreductase subunit N [Gemmatimonadaceae bacterium]